MLVYYILLITPLLFSLSKYKKQKTCVFMLFFLILLFLLCFRNICVGIDLKSYNYMFIMDSKSSWNEILGNKETLFHLLNKIVYKLGGNYRSIIIICSILCILPIWYVYKKESQDALLAVILFANMTNFIMMFSGLRQSIAFSIGVLAFYNLKNKKFISYFICVVLAYLFHQSAFILLFLLPLYFIKNNNKNLYIFLPILLVSFIFKEQILEFIVKFLPEDYTENFKTTQTNAYGSLILFLIFTIFSFVVSDDKSKEVCFYRNILCLITLIQVFAPIHFTAMRFNYYFTILIPIILPNIIKNAKIQFREITFYSRLIMIIFFLFWFYYNAYSAVYSTEGTLNVFPYYFMWQVI